MAHSVALRLLLHHTKLNAMGPAVSACSLQSCLQAVAAPGGCPTARTALVYKLRAPDTAVLGLYAALSKHYQHAISPRYCSTLA